VIAARPGQGEIKALQASRILDYPAEQLEVIVARGRQPSAQRNKAIEAAQGEWIYFLDDDSEPEPRNLGRAVGQLKANVQMLGGPNICPPNAPWLEQVFALVLASWALGPSRARYAGIGQPRATSEKELILCNLLARRSALLELGGFNEALYPNEENALMDELQKRGGTLLYDPAVYVFRRPRSSLRSFAKMLMTYGRGRAEQFRLHPTLGSVLNFLTPLFSIYLLLAVVGLTFLPSIGKYLVIPLLVYFIAVFTQALALIGFQPARECNASAGFITRVMRALTAIPLIVLTHVLYGFGFWRGLLTTVQPKPERKAEVQLEILKRLGSKEWSTTPVSPR